MEIKVPAVGESVTEALIAKWHKKDGERVEKDEPLCEIETDKITMEINAEAAGALFITVPEGTTVAVGTVIGVIKEGTVPKEAPTPLRRETPSPSPAGSIPPFSPAVRKMVQEKGLRPDELHGTGRGGRVTVDDLLNTGTGNQGPGLRDQEPGSGEKPVSPVTQPILPGFSRPGPSGPQSGPRSPASTEAPPSPVPGSRSPISEDRVTRTPMTPIRRRIAERLLAARQQTAMLTTFNEADMGAIIELRKKHNEHFQKKFGVKLGYMSFFVKACLEALKEFPMVNSRIDGSDIVTPHFHDIGIAVSGEKGLVVPVLRDADRLHFADIEKGIAAYAEKVRTNRLELADLEGGTFTISNGGIYGSLLSTPIINPPQSGVLGMHAVQDRPVARNGTVVIRPMMYLALSYDHRIIDGREAVGFLKKVKEYVEEPEEMLLEG
ncbi:2-oxoglutarate dehydrogenase complex dihydrolipoyllysine-residue succinyltransferase [Geomobilimonas luticola]|uniref:Dihydrolipoyllysine-residue succinyltransferase component of 2-oxoglutarate dehydrogenase complex n=1 Tax=Geomobilimonas luticola TaxID=1114878 RepID=A0ABS5SD06_9BACT|nr:2-oxoglutarate dehydrogenase complex dihydrolipoyllysine-residue succinyltransferase [Geomobilimonas luticola]MBT0653248.1 2-oxoglutarate dehydrogenase complex dihydrolipoyllysine-residue succinyltransferase [Geomobilimonas luticola]